MRYSEIVFDSTDADEGSRVEGSVRYIYTVIYRCKYCKCEERHVIVVGEER
jgi:hypothetical protein